MRACHAIIISHDRACHSHTFENRSSLAPNPPPEGLLVDCTGGLEAAGVSGAALLHPPKSPKSSSTATFGAALELLPPPAFDAPVELPHEEKSLVVDMAGDLLSVFGFTVVEGSGLAQALLEPQGSSLENPENALELTGASGADLGVGCGTGAGAERLKAEFRVEGGGAGFEGMLGCEGVGSEKSKRSLGALLAAGFVVGAVVDAKLKSSSGFDALGVRNGWVFCVGGFDVIAGFSAGLGLVSKNPPPLNGGGDVIEGEAKLVRCAEGLLKLANGSLLGAGCACGGGGAVVDAKLRPPKASSSPDDCCVVGDCMPPKMSWLSCCGCDCVRGAEAYKERIDCLRSGLEGAATLPGVDAALEGLAEEAGGAPKKSSPRSESPCFCCFGGAGMVLGGGGRVRGVSVVLGRAGGVGMSPNKSTFDTGFGVAFGGWLEVDASR